MRRFGCYLLGAATVVLAVCTTRPSADALGPSLRGTRDPGEPLPPLLQDVAIRITIFEGDVSVLDVGLQAPQGASVERIVPDRFGVSHDLRIQLGTLDIERNEQVLTFDYATDGGSFRDVLRCRIGDPHMVFAGGRRLEIAVISVPTFDAESSLEDSKTSTSSNASSSPDDGDPALWVIPD